MSVYSPVARAVDQSSSVTVSQQVIDNSSGGGSGGGGTGGSGGTGGGTGSTGGGTGGSTGGTGGSTGGSGGVVGGGGGSGGSGGTGGGTGSTGGGGGVVDNFTQAVNSIIQGISDAFDTGLQSTGVVGAKILEISKVITDNTNQIVNSPVGKIATKIVQPIGVISGGIAIGAQVLISTTSVASFYDVYLLILRIIGLILGMFRKKRKPWGTVYDSVTKRPLDPAYVTITKDGVEVSDAITDLDGRFGFFLPGGNYTLNASKTNYAFPSKKLEGREKDEMYENIYHGDNVENKEGEVVIKNIPLDPVNFDWNEFEKNKHNLFRIYSEKEKKWKRSFDSIYKIGFVGSILGAIFDGNYINYSFLLFYLGINIYQMFFIAKRTAVSLKHASSGDPIPYSIVKLFSAEAGIEVKSVVSDQLGRFYLLVGPGKYYMTVDEKMPDASYQTIYKSGVMDLKDGIVPNDVII